MSARPPALPRRSSRVLVLLWAALLGGAVLGSSAVGSADDGSRAPPKAATPTGDRADVIHTPPREQEVGFPVPLYVEVRDDPPEVRVVVRYRHFGMKKGYKGLEMKRMGSGLGVLIPCEDLTVTGTLRYYLTFFDEHGPASTLRSPEAPFEVAIVNEHEGEPLRLPGQPPLRSCATVCPPPELARAYYGIEEPPAPPPPAPPSRGCAGCRAAQSPPNGPFAVSLAALAAAWMRRRAARRASSHGMENA